MYAQGAGLGASKGKDIGKFVEGFSNYVIMAKDSVSLVVQDLLTFYAYNSRRRNDMMKSVDFYLGLGIFLSWEFSPYLLSISHNVAYVLQVHFIKGVTERSGSSVKSHVLCDAKDIERNYKKRLEEACGKESGKQDCA